MNSRSMITFCPFLSALIVLVTVLLQSVTSCAFVSSSGDKNCNSQEQLRRQQLGCQRHQHQQRRGTSRQLISNGIDYSFLRADRNVILSKEDILDRRQLEYITDLVNRRSEARKKGEYELADLIREKINYLHTTNTRSDPLNHNDVYDEQLFIPEGYKIEIKDIPRSEGGGSIWTLQLKEKQPIDWVQSTTENDKDYNNFKFKSDNTEKLDNNSSVLKIAHTALGLASWSSENKVPINQEVLNNLVHQAKKRLLQTGSGELRGRKAADAAFWFSMAGVIDDRDLDAKDTNFCLFDALTFICIDELRRFGKRASCRATDIMHMVERIAASGIQSEMSTFLQKEAAECLLTKDLASSGLKDKEIIKDLESGSFHLHSARPLLWIWRFSTRQRKQQAFLQSASKHWESKNKTNLPSAINKEEKSGEFRWDDIFEDPTKPLVLDIGCGMGISLLGLASLSEKEGDLQDKSFLNIDWSDCNFFGADLSQLAINYASTISQRWKLESKVHFQVISAENAVEQIMKTYPGSVQLALIQFPTPFSFQEYGTNGDDEKGDNILQSVVKSGNRQLPKSAINGFMVTKQLLDQVHQTLEPSTGKLLLQSNCEDVAVFMKNIATDEVGFNPINVPDRVESINERGGMTMRTSKWVSQGGERAEGACWSTAQILPSYGSTETEIACEMNGTPVHRCILKVNIT